MYSLLSASVLAIDLARHPNGAAVADVVDRVLALTPVECALMGAPAQPSPRERVLAACSASARAAGGPASGLDGHRSPGVAGASVAALSQTAFGGVLDVLDMLGREQPLVWLPADAKQVPLDAVLVAWAGSTAELGDVVLLRSPWLRAISPVPASLPETSYREALVVLLEEVNGRSSGQWQRVADAHRAHRGRMRWSKLMHQACRAAFDAGRLHDVARAQLAAARALRLSVASTEIESHALAMSVTAAVQAVCTADLLDTSGLQEAWLAGS